MIERALYPPRVTARLRRCGFIDHACSYPPEDLGVALAAQLRRGVPTHNEIVLDPSSVIERLPHSIAAIFYQSRGSYARAKEVHEAFLSEFGLGNWEVPLVHLRLRLEDRELLTLEPCTRCESS